MKSNDNENQLSKPQDSVEKKGGKKQNQLDKEVGNWDFMSMIKSSLKFLPLGLGFYDELSDIIYYKNAEFKDQELKNIFLFFLFLSPAIQMICWVILLKKVNYRKQLK